MIGLHCDTCDLPLVLTARVQGEQVVVERHPYTECRCSLSPEELLAIVEDAYQEELCA